MLVSGVEFSDSSLTYSTQWSSQPPLMPFSRLAPPPPASLRQPCLFSIVKDLAYFKISFSREQFILPPWSTPAHLHLGSHPCHPPLGPGLLSRLSCWRTTLLHSAPIFLPLLTRLVKGAFCINVSSPPSVHPFSSSARSFLQLIVGSKVS